MAANGSDPVSQASVTKHFRFLPWQTQVAMVFAAAATLGGGTVGLGSIMKPDPVVAEIRDILEEHRNETRGINSSLIVKLDSLNTHANKIYNAMMYDMCEDPASQEWIDRQGRRGEEYCRAVEEVMEREFIRGAYAR